MKTEVAITHEIFIVRKITISVFFLNLGKQQGYCRFCFMNVQVIFPNLS